MSTEQPFRRPEELTDLTVAPAEYVESIAKGRTWQEIEALSRRERDKARECDLDIRDLESQIAAKREERQTHLDQAEWLHAESERLQSPDS